MKNIFKSAKMLVLAFVISLLGVICPDISIVKIDSICGTSTGMNVTYNGYTTAVNHTYPIHNGNYAVIYQSNINSQYDFVGYII